MEAYRVKASGPNTACQLLQHLGVANVGLPGYGKMRSASHTKRGPGRRFTIGDGTRTSQQRQAGAYGRGLMNSSCALSKSQKCQNGTGLRLKTLDLYFANAIIRTRPAQPVAGV